MWIPTEHEKYGVGKFIALIFSLSFFFKLLSSAFTHIQLEGMCELAPLMMISSSAVCYSECFFFFLYIRQHQLSFKQPVMRELGFHQTGCHIAKHRVVALTPHGLPNEQPQFDFFPPPLCSPFALFPLALSGNKLVWHLDSEVLLYLLHCVCLNGGKSAAYHSQSLYYSMSVYNSLNSSKEKGLRVCFGVSEIQIAV